MNEMYVCMYSNRNRCIIHIYNGKSVTKIYIHFHNLLILKPSVDRSVLQLSTQSNDLSNVMKKPTWFLYGPTQIELYKHRRWLEAGNFRFRK